MALQEGKYTGRAVRARWGESKAKGTLGCEIVFEIQETEQIKSTKNHVVWITENTAQRAADTLALVGIPHDSMDKNGNNEFDVKGQDVSLTLENEVYTKDGVEKTALKIKWVNAIGGGSAFDGSSVHSMKVKATQLDLSALIKAAQMTSGAPAPKPATSSSAPSFNQDEDIPF